MITYLKGDATEPVTKPALIIHVVNDMGGWGRGFVLAISKKWKIPEQKYRASFILRDVKLGKVQFVWVDEAIVVANMFAQHGYVSSANPIALDYNALEHCFAKVQEWITENTLGPATQWSIHAPRLGCGLAGGSWPEVEKRIDSFFGEIPVHIYDL
jgi:hypothetical protein